MACEWARGKGEDTETDMREIEAEAMEKTRKCLMENAGILERMAQALLRQETLHETEIVSLTEGFVFEKIS